MNDSMVVFLPEELMDLLPAIQLDPEELAIQQQNKEGKELSKEAKGLVLMVLHTPEELKRAAGLTFIGKPISKRMITTYLRNRGWNWRKIRKTYSELNNFVAGF